MKSHPKPQKVYPVNHQNSKFRASGFSRLGRSVGSLSDQHLIRWVFPAKDGTGLVGATSHWADREEAFLAVTQITKVSASSPYHPVISQHPTVGKLIPTTIAASSEVTLLALSAKRGAAEASNRLPTTFRFGRGSVCQS